MIRTGLKFEGNLGALGILTLTEYDKIRSSHLFQWKSIIILQQEQQKEVCIFWLLHLYEVFFRVVEEMHIRNDW